MKKGGDEEEMGGYRWRNMYYLTGLPGWMRFGYSPGWIGRSPTGLPPAAQYLIQTGQMPQFGSWIQQQAPAPTGVPAMPKEQEISMLESQAKMLGDQLEQIKKRLEELRK
ncbi:MAG: DUF5320 domain-containing protein [Methanophagales archaeon]|nr:DUF5320 domain-containing protein [Methanophagales archaeon]